MDDSKLIFWTGAPGSKWSSTSWALTKTKKILIDNSDNTPERHYVIPEKFQHPEVSFKIKHVGSYFGPGMEFGQNFHRINTLTKDEIKKEINKAFNGKHPEKYKIVRCHQFVYNLDWIRDNFPTSKIVIVYRKPEASINGWLTAGGIEIKHPDYKKYYKDNETAKKLITEEALLATKWMFENDMDIHVACRGHFKNYWGVTFNDELEKKGVIIRAMEGYFEANNDKKFEKLKYDVRLGYYNFS